MKNQELENWERIKEAMEESGNTDNNYYRRAIAIVAGFDDPLEEKLKPEEPTSSD